MKAIIDKNATAKEIEAAKRKVKRKTKNKTGISKFFGALKRGIDGNAYQKNMRNEWN
jgi:hypothetical protein